MSAHQAGLEAQQTGGDAPLLWAGAMTGPLFYGAIAAQVVLRQGFDVLHDPLSLLTLGPAGWIQRGVFLLSGLLVLVGLIGARGRQLRGRAERWAIALLVVFGLGTLLAGVFTPDPAFGFPPGTPPGAPTTMTTHSMIHGACFDASFLAAIVAMVLVGLANLRLDRGWAGFSFLCAAAIPLLIVAGMSAHAVMGLSFLVAGAVGFAWVSLSFYGLLHRPRRRADSLR